MTTTERETISVQIVAKTTKAICVKDLSGEETWLPLSQIVINFVTFKDKKEFASVELPLWLAKNKDLI